MNLTEPTVIRLDESEKVAFSSDSYYQPILTSEVGDLPIFTGIQTAEPGYQTPPHARPYLEILHLLEGTMEVCRLHIFRASGKQNLRLLGTPLSSKRIVDYTDGNTVVME
ncbi:hypothetical protein NKDENANG_01870 [Candidatus Entotheonellaceae bacterium PAL068K]